MDKYEIVRYFYNLKCNDALCKDFCPFYEECNYYNPDIGLCDMITKNWNKLNENEQGYRTN